MRKVYLSYNNIISSLGASSSEVVDKISREESGLEVHHNTNVLPDPFYASIIDRQKLETDFQVLSDSASYTTLEKMMILSLDEVISKSKITLTDRVGLIVSTTKGNVDVLETSSSFPKERAYLHELGDAVAGFYGFATQPIVLSNACVSGVLAVAVAKRLILEGTFDHVFITSGDLVSQFILSGFNSFQALSTERCKPYCSQRSGINIGEVAASILVTSERNKLCPEAVSVLGESSCNDANHISGPSRTGEGLFRSVKRAMAEANIGPEKIDYISAHGTATQFNDEMEAIAFDRVGLSMVPINSLKGYFGHTLGASGLIETIVGMHSVYNNTLYKSLGFEALGVSRPINIIESTEEKDLRTFLKTASGFGGCNTAVIFEKVS